MSSYYFAIVKQEPACASSEGDGNPIAEVVLWTESDSADTGFAFGALHSLGISQRGSITLADETKLAVFPNGLSEDQPDWSDSQHKLWILRRLAP
jgi:hypothetical protein